MPGVKPLAVSANCIYTYDGSFNGFLCCVHESVYSGRLPADIQRADDAPITLLETVEVVTDSEKAGRVLKSVPAKISSRALGLVKTVFLSCLEGKELKLLTFLLRGYREGQSLVYSLGDTDVSPLLRAERHLLGEAQLLRGFVRFSDVGGVLVSAITPKNFILPFIAGHFRLRYDNEDFMIFDKTHKAALVCQGGKSDIFQVDHIDFPEAGEEELRYRELWRRFYDTVAIEGRENPRCRMTHMPKRYWENMLEVRDLL